MREAKFTKGQWNFNPEMEIDDSMVITDDNYNPIAYLETNSVFDGSGYVNQLTDEQDANAHLIAAAPELYETLEKIMKHLNHGCGDAIEYLNNSDYCINKLLAKARGEDV